MTPEAVAKKAMDACLEKAALNILAIELTEDGPEQQDPSQEWLDIRMEFRRLAALYPKVAASYSKEKLVPVGLTQREAIQELINGNREWLAARGAK